MKAVIAFIFVAVFAAIASAAPVRVSQSSPGKATPDDRARQWLTLLDDGDYGRSWQESGKALRSREDAASWTSRIKAMREPLGAMASRNLRLIELVNSEKVVVRYDSVFAHKATAQETVTLGLENGGWAVIDYALK
ncbi:MAG TPA: DUF4019 domain-containing protein [Rhizomicrobium sp.]|jgi:hypothetical protein|nr:DUF4019 domain-containing protein [Rhizomicrobium sp.]